MTSHIEQKLASMDLRFQYALADARTLETHSVTMGAQFEDHVREIIELFVPSGYRVRGALLPPAGMIPAIRRNSLISSCTRRRSRDCMKSCPWIGSP